MIKSMTGYGKAVESIENKKITVEVKSLNSKQLDLNLRLPGIYREKEIGLRGQVSKLLERGKADIGLYYESSKPEKKLTINGELFQDYYNDLKKVTAPMGEDGHGDLLSIIMKMPEILKSERPELNDDEWEGIEQIIFKAIQRLDEFRVAEGESLEKDLRLRISNIEHLLSEIETYEGERIAGIRERINNNLEELAAKKQIDQNRFEQEMIYYLEKLDITEEKVRLRTHCNYFIETIDSDDSQGKKLGFIGQEIGREINTIGSKSNHASIQKLVVQMKDELEKVKEQVLNVL